MAGRRPSEHQVDLAPGRDLDLLISLAEGAGPGSLRIVSDPGGAISAGSIFKTSVYENGNKVPTAPAPGANDVALAVPMTGGGHEGIGGNGQGNRAAVEIAEILVYTNAVDETGRLIVEKYLKQK
jgi:hypothetical protein